MKTDRETTDAVRSWLEEGVTQLPDRVLDEVLDQIPAVRQRQAWWRRWGFPVARSAVPAALAAGAILAILGVTTVAPGLNLGGPMQSAAPNSTVSPRAFPPYPEELAPGTYVIDDPFPVRVTLDVAEGWQSCRWGPQEVGPCAVREGPGIAFLIVDNVVADPCDADRAMLDPPVGPSVDDLVAAISALPGFEATEPTDINVDGFSGQEFVLTAPNPAGCRTNAESLGTWSTMDRVNGVGPGEVTLLQILDVDGVRIVIAATYDAARAQQDLDQIRQVIDSVQIEP